VGYHQAPVQIPEIKSFLLRKREGRKDQLEEEAEDEAGGGRKRRS
jgi:hypothetical protein